MNKLGQMLGVDLDVVISLNNLDGMALTDPKHLDLTARPSHCLVKSALDIQTCSISSLNV